MRLTTTRATPTSSSNCGPWQAAIADVELAAPADGEALGLFDVASDLLRSSGKSWRE
ncbi:MAG TPA: hypothetical protein VF526_04145 [Solirubrobacteraceae bacterium]